MSKESPSEFEVRKFLEAAGYSVRRLAESSSARSPDFLASHETGEIVVEVKSRGADRKFIEQLSKTGRAESETVLRRRNPISERIMDAREQLLCAARRDGPLSLLLIALVANGDDAEFQAEEFKAALYGLVYLIRWTRGVAESVPCFHFDFSDFYRAPEIDAAAIVVPGGALLCINSFSNRRKLLENSKLYHELSAAGAVIDPAREEELGEAFIADTDLDRRNDADVMKYIRTKYGIPDLLMFRPTRYRAGAEGPLPLT